MRNHLTHILLTGATGYIGGSVLARLLSHSLSDTFQLAVLVRSPEKAKQFRTLGIKAVVGSNSDHELLRQLAGDADIVFACADADDLGAAQAILVGMKDHYERTGKPASLIHTSGTGVLTDDADGMHPTEEVYSDLDIAKLEALAPTQPHRNVDLALVQADTEGYVKTHIILPSTIYGIASGPLVDLGLQNSHSQQIPQLVKVSLDRGQGGMVGLGKNLWPNVHIKDVTELYILLFDQIISPKTSHTPEHGRFGFYFGENGEHSMYDIAAAIARMLYESGRGESPHPTTFTKEEMKKYFPNGTSLGTNSRCKADRARALGWRPRKETSDMLASIKGEL